VTIRSNDHDWQPFCCLPLSSAHIAAGTSHERHGLKSFSKINEPTLTLIVYQNAIIFAFAELR